MRKLRRRVYLAGPITKGDISHNIEQSRIAMRKLLLAGFAVLNPMLSCFAESNTPSAAAGVSHDVWLESDLSWVVAADAILRLPGESVGADEEVAFAIDRGIPIFYSVESLVKQL